MLQAGSYQTLTVSRISDHGLYLADIDGEYQMDYSRNSTSDDSPYYITYFTGEPEDAPKMIDGVEAILGDMPPADDYDLVMNGVGYYLNDYAQSAEAHVIGNASDVIVPTTVTENGTEYRVYEVYIEDVTINSAIISEEELSDDYFITISLNGSNINRLDIRHHGYNLDAYRSDIGQLNLYNKGYPTGNVNASATHIGSVTYHGDSGYYADISWMNGLFSLGSLTFEGDVWDVMGGPLYIPGYTGVGSELVEGDVSYWLTIYDGEYVAEAIVAYNYTINLVNSIDVEGVSYKTRWTEYTDLWNVTTIIVESIPNDFRLSSPFLDMVIFDNTEKIDIPPFAFNGCDSLETVIFDGPIGTITVTIE